VPGAAVDNHVSFLGFAGFTEDFFDINQALEDWAVIPDYDY